MTLIRKIPGGQAYRWLLVGMALCYFQNLILSECLLQRYNGRIWLQILLVGSPKASGWTLGNRMVGIMALWPVSRLFATAEPEGGGTVSTAGVATYHVFDPSHTVYISFSLALRCTPKYVTYELDLNTTVSKSGGEKRK